MAKTEDVAFAIISAAGDGRAKVAEALKQARRGNFGEAEECLKDADEHLLKAHKLQTEELLQKEANGELQGPFNVLISHAQDYVMTGMAMKDMAVEIVNLYTQLRANSQLAPLDIADRIFPVRFLVRFWFVANDQ